MGGLEEPATSAWGGSKVLEFGGMGSNHEEDPGELSMMAKQANRETCEVEEAIGAGEAVKRSWRENQWARQRPRVDEDAMESLFVVFPFDVP